MCVMVEMSVFKYFDYDSTTFPSISVHPLRLYTFLPAQLRVVRLSDRRPSV